MTIKLSDFQTRLPTWKVEDVGSKPAELDHDDVCLKPVDGGKVAPASFEDAVEAYYNAPADGAVAAGSAKIPVAEFEKKLVGWTVEDSGDQAGFLDRGDVVLKPTSGGAKVVVSYDVAEKAYRGGPLDAADGGVYQALPAELRPKVTVDSLVTSKLASVHYRKRDGSMKVRGAYPAWLFTPQFNDHALRHGFPKPAAKDLFVQVKGSFEEAVKVAADRAQNRATYCQAQGVVDLGGGEWAVCGLGEVSNLTMWEIIIDGHFSDGEQLGETDQLESVEKFDESLGGIVGGKSIIDLRNVPVGTTVSL